MAATLARLLCGRGVDGARADHLVARGLQRARVGVGVQALCADLGVDPSHYGREFLKRVGCTPSQLSRWERTACAADLLQKTALPLSQVALRAGYCDQSHMCRELQRVMGRTPRSIRAVGVQS